MKFSKSKKSLCAFLSAVTALNCMPACIQTYAVNDSVQKYEFENGSTDGGKIYTETWKGNTQENGSGEDFDLTKVFKPSARTPEAFIANDCDGLIGKTIRVVGIKEYQRGNFDAKARAFTVQ